MRRDAAPPLLFFSRRVQFFSVRFFSTEIFSGAAIRSLAVLSAPRARPSPRMVVAGDFFKAVVPQIPVLTVSFGIYLYLIDPAIARKWSTKSALLDPQLRSLEDLLTGTPGGADAALKKKNDAAKAKAKAKAKAAE